MAWNALAASAASDLERAAKSSRNATGAAAQLVAPVEAGSSLCVAVPFLPLSLWPVCVSAVSHACHVSTSVDDRDCSLSPLPELSVSVGSATLRLALMQHALRPVRTPATLAAHVAAAATAAAAAASAPPTSSMASAASSAPPLAAAAPLSSSSRLVEFAGGLLVYGSALKSAAASVYHLSGASPALGRHLLAEAYGGAPQAPPVKAGSSGPVAAALAKTTPLGQPGLGAGLGGFSLRLGRVGLVLTEYSPILDTESWIRQRTALLPPVGATSASGPTTTTGHAGVHASRYALHHNCLAFSRPHEHRDNKLNVFVIDGGLFYQRAAEYDLAMAEAAATVGARDAMFTLPGSEEANFDVEPMVASLAGCVGVGPALRSRSHSRNSITADDTDENGVWNLAMSGDEVNNDGVWQLKAACSH